MSAFLGPIHNWLFHKIELQNELTDTLIAAFPAREAEVLLSLADSCGTPAVGELADIIDGTNIHGWLQGQVTIAENRLARAAGMLATDETAIEALKQAAYEAGTRQPITASSAQDAYRALNDVLLDGMPCDRVNMLRTQTDEKTSWERVTDLHSAYWKAAQADPALFDVLRSAWVSGMLAKNALTYRQDGPLFLIERT